MNENYLGMIEKLLFLNGKLEAIIESSTNGIFELDEAGMVGQVNPAFRTIFDMTMAEPEAGCLYQYIPSGEIVDEIKDMVSHKKSVFFKDFIINTARGRDEAFERFVEMKLVTIPSGSHAQFIGIIKDKSDVLRALANRESFISHLLNLVEEIKVDNRSTIYHLASLVELRDSDTGEHLERVEAYTRILATAYYEAFRERDKWVTPSYVEDMAVSAVLHDIGKVGITDSILLKPSGLSDIEMDAMKEHTIIAGRALEKHKGKKDFLALGREIALSHHEKWNGKGYPRQLRGREIPLSARIVSLCDTYDAITHDRPYKKALGHDEAVRIIESEKGSAFDPEIVDLFLENHLRFRDVNLAKS